MPTMCSLTFHPCGFSEEGGYEALGSGIYYGMPGPFAEPVEELIVGKVKDMASKVQKP